MKNKWLNKTTTTTATTVTINIVSPVSVLLSWVRSIKSSPYIVPLDEHFHFLLYFLVYPVSFCWVSNRCPLSTIVGISTFMFTLCYYEEFKSLTFRSSSRVWYLFPVQDNSRSYLVCLSLSFFIFIGLKRKRKKDHKTIT